MTAGTTNAEPADDRAGRARDPVGAEDRQLRRGRAGEEVAGGDSVLELARVHPAVAVDHEALQQRDVRRRPAEAGEARCASTRARRRRAGREPRHHLAQPAPRARRYLTACPAIVQALQPTRRRPRHLVAALSVTETVSWGVLYYAFSVFLVPMRDELGLSTAQLTGAFSLALLVAGAAGILVGRHLDRHAPRALMTAGSVAGVVAVLAWSRVDSLVAVYAVWLAIGLVMATVLYEPAFTVLAKAFADAGDRRRAMTALTLVAALSSFIFLPLAQALVDLHGWRQALVDLALVLLLITVPLHAWALPRSPPAPSPAHALGRSGRAQRALLAALGRVLPGHGDRHRRHRSGHPAARRTRPRPGVRRLRRRARRGRPDPRAAPVRAARLAAAARPRGRRGVPGRRRRHRRHRRALALARGRPSASSCSGWATAWPRSPARPRSPTSTARARTGRSRHGRRADHGARALGPAAAALLAAAVGFDALLWLFAAVSVVAAVLAASTPPSPFDNSSVIFAACRFA